MSRNVEDLFGGTIEAIQQEIGGFNAVGGETGFDVKKRFRSISVFLDSAYQDPETAFTVNGSVITLAEVLNPGVRVSYILNANWNPGDGSGSAGVSEFQVVNYFYTVIGGEQTITIPNEYPVFVVQAIYLEGSRQDRGQGFSYDTATKTITLAEALPSEAAGSVITIQLGQANTDTPETALSILKSVDGAGMVGTSSGKTVQAELDVVAEDISSNKTDIDGLQAFQAALATVDGAKLSLSQVATAYGLDFTLGNVWTSGTTSTVNNWWWYNNKVYTGIVGTLPASPAANTYQIPPFAKRGFVSVKDFGAIGSRTTTEDDAPAFAAAIAYLKTIGGGTLIIPTGVYDIYSSISLVGVRIILQGSGRDMTNIRAANAMDRMIDVGETSDNKLPGAVNDLGILCNNLANYGIYHTQRHNFYVRAVQVFDALSANLYADRTWLTGYSDCAFNGGNGDMIRLGGSNHRMAFDRCTIGSNKSSFYGIKINNVSDDGVVLEYSKALVFNNCDVEYTDASGGRGIYVNALEVSFNNCYIGEFVLGTVMDVVRGLVNINNGIFYYGATPASIGINAAGGTTRFKGVLIRPHDTLAQMYIDTLVSGSSGKVSFQDINISRDDISGATVPDILHNKQIPGDLLLAIPSATGSFVPRMGAQYTTQSVDATITNSSGTDGSRVLAVTAIGTTSTHQAAFVASILNKLSVPGALLLEVVYQSNVALPVIIESSAFAGGGTTIGTLPSTSGVKKTYFLVYTTTSAALPTGNVIRIGGDMVVGSTATLYKLTLTDSLSFNGNAGSTSYKNIGMF